MVSDLSERSLKSAANNPDFYSSIGNKGFSVERLRKLQKQKMIKNLVGEELGSIPFVPPA